MNRRAGTPLPGSPRRCSTSAHPLTRSVFAHFNEIPSFAYCDATVEPSLCLLNTSAPATNLSLSDNLTTPRDSPFPQNCPSVFPSSRNGVVCQVTARAFDNIPRKFCRPASIQVVHRDDAAPLTSTCLLR